MLQLLNVLRDTFIYSSMYDRLWGCFMMNKRDLRIINDLERFRVMSRDDIADLYFTHLKNPVTNTNTVLKRLVRDGQIEVSKNFSPFVYFPAGSIMKRNSTKIPHFFKVVEVYKELIKHAALDKFIVEPKFQKGLAEPDAITVIKGKPFFIELQRNVYSQRTMDRKMQRYEALYLSDELDGKKPFIIMISDTRYEIKSDLLTVFQVTSINEFMEKLQKRKQPTRKADNEIKMKIG